MGDGIPFDDWSRLGRDVSLVANSSSWWLGDWLVYGQERFADRYRRCLGVTGLDYQTLRNYAWVARNVPLSRRRDGLSFQHHAEVASLPPEQQVYWLDRAVRGSWSRSRLRSHIRAGRAKRAVAARDRRDTVLRLPAGREAVWQHAAELARMDLVEWAARELDRAAAQKLGAADRSAV